MKLQILQLDPTDDQVSVRDKLARAKSNRVLLVWPRRGDPLPNRLDLVLVKRKAIDLGLQLGLLSYDPDVQDTAKQIGLPLFASVEEASTDDWPEPQGIAYPARPGAKQKRELLSSHPGILEAKRDTIGWPGWLRYSLFSLAMLAVVALAVSLAPSATLIVQPETNRHEMTTILWLITPEENRSTEEPTILATTRTVLVQASDRIEASGSSRVPDEFADGVLRFSNLTEEPLLIPAGTSVRSTEFDGVRFVTTEAAELPGGRGVQLDIQAQAAEAGPAGNVPSESIDAVDGPLGLQVQVNNPAAFSGGSTRSLPIITEQDRRQLQDQLEQTLVELATKRLQESLPTGESLVEASVEIDDIQQLEFDAEPGQTAASLGLTIEAEMHGLSVSFEALRAGLEEQLAVREGQDGHLIPGSLHIRQRQTIRQGERFGVQINAEWDSYNPFNKDALRQAVAGWPRDTELEPIEKRFDLDILQVVLWPNWLPNYPWIPSRITIQLPWQTG